MRHFDKSYFDKWNDRLKKINLFLSLEGIIGYTNSYINVITIWRFDNNHYQNFQGFNQKTPTDSIHWKNGSSGNPIYKVPEITYFFNFSVSKKCSKRFYDLLQTILESGSVFCYTTTDKIDKPNMSNKEIKTYRKNLSDFTIEKSDIKIHNVEYIQNTCKLTCDLFEVIHFVNSVESAVEIISKYFEYEQDGKEICKTKFQVNEIVSTKNDKSGNYMILDFFIQQDNTISYKVSKIQNCITSEVILFEGISILKEEDILPNREDRLNIILN